MPNLKIIFAAALIIVSCGPRKGGETPVHRDFPRVEVPAVYTSEPERLLWGTTHYWDNYLNPAKAVKDTLNGISLEALEQEVGTYTSLLNMLSPKDGRAAVEHLWKSIESFNAAADGSTVPIHLSELMLLHRQK